MRNAMEAYYFILLNHMILDLKVGCEVWNCKYRREIWVMLIMLVPVFQYFSCQKQKLLKAKMYSNMILLLHLSLQLTVSFVRETLKVLTVNGLPVNWWHVDQMQ